MSHKLLSNTETLFYVIMYHVIHIRAEFSTTGIRVMNGISDAGVTSHIEEVTLMMMNYA